MSTNSMTLASATGMSDRDQADRIRYDDLISMARTAWLYDDTDDAGDKLAEKARKLAHSCAWRGFYDPLIDQLQRNAF